MTPVLVLERGTGTGALVVVLAVAPFTIATMSLAERSLEHGSLVCAMFAGTSAADLQEVVLRVFRVGGIRGSVVECCRLGKGDC